LILTWRAGSGGHCRARDDEFRLPRPTSLRIPPALLLANDTYADGDALFVLRVGETNNTTQVGGNVTLAGNTILYTPPAGAVASDQFAYTVTDGLGGQATARMNLVFDPVAPPPPPIINPPQPQSDGTILLSGSAPPESVVVI
jgi:large repetitive protein